MSYLVLARKHRPQSFDDIVGQDHIVRTLQNAMAMDRLHHAFLFTGARGVGKTTTARVLAKALDVQGADLFEIDAASNTGVDNVRELRENVRYMPSRGQYKLYIIDEVHMLSTAAFNALLKTLEEPPPHVKFIFATTEPQKIPVTILSRCQRFDFRRVSVPVLTGHVKRILELEGITMGPGAIGAVVREAQGSVRDALSLLDQVLSYTGVGEASGGELDDARVIEALGVVDRETLFNLCDAVLGRRAADLLDIVGAIDARGHDLSDVAGLVVEHLRDLTVVKVVDEPTEQMLERSPGEIEAMRKQGETHNRADLHRLFALMVSVAEDVSRSTHPRVSLEMGLLRLLEVEPSQSLTTLIGRLDNLVGGSGPVAAKAPPVASESAPAAAPASARAEPAPSPVADSPEPSAEAAGGDRTGWKTLVDKVREKRPAVASVLEHGRLLAFGPEGVEIGYPAGTFYYEQARDEDNRALVSNALSEHFSAKVPLSFRQLEGEAAHTSLAEQQEMDRQSREQQIKDGALEHPAVRGALDILGGEVKKVIPLVDEDSGADKVTTAKAD